MNDYTRAVESLTLCEEREAAIRKLLRERTGAGGRKTFRLSHRLPLVAAAVLVLAFSVSAALSRISMHVASLQVDGADGVCTVSFTQGDDLPVGLGCWYPNGIGAEYELERVTSDENGCQDLVFRRNWDDKYTLLYFRADAASSFTLENVAAEGACEVNGHPGHWFRLTSAEVYNDRTRSLKPVPVSVLFWVDETRGVGFRLAYCGSDTMDLTALAESVTELDEPLPTVNAPYAQAALRTLGDYDFADVPEGFYAQALYGEPTIPLDATFADQRGYVHRIYLDGELYSLHLYYVYLPTYLLYYEQLDIEEPEVYRVPHTSEPIMIGDVPGEAVYEADSGRLLGVSWKSTDARGAELSFSVTADRLDLPALLALAQSVVCRAESTVAAHTR